MSESNAVVETKAKDTTLSEEDKKMLKSVFWRAAPIAASRIGGSVRQHAAGVEFCLAPVFRRYYGEGTEEFRQAMIRHTSMYNITIDLSTFGMGMVAAMERENAQDPNFDANSITAIKASIMGPMCGIGDPLMWGVVRVIAASIAIGLAMQGSLLAPVIFLLVYNIIGQAIRWKLTFVGFEQGGNFLKKMNESGLMATVTKCASILGLIMVGVLALAILLALLGIV